MAAIVATDQHRPTPPQINTATDQHSGVIYNPAAFGPPCERFRLCMTPDVRHARNFQEFLTPEGCWILEVANDEDDPAASIARALMFPGVTTELHRLAGVIERYVIVSGTGRVELTPANAEDVEPGDVVRIPSGVGQRITNTGANDLVFLCVCTPRFAPASYERIEKE